jgi:hypothetical protein
MSAESLALLLPPLSVSQVGANRNSIRGNPEEFRSIEVNQYKNAIIPLPSKESEVIKRKPGIAGSIQRQRIQKAIADQFEGSPE